MITSIIGLRHDINSKTYQIRVGYAHNTRRNTITERVDHEEHKTRVDHERLYVSTCTGEGDLECDGGGEGEEMM